MSSYLDKSFVLNQQSLDQILVLPIASYGKVGIVTFMKHLAVITQCFKLTTYEYPKMVKYFSHPWSGYMGKLLLESDKAALNAIWGGEVPAPADFPLPVDIYFFSLHGHKNTSIISEFQQTVIDIANTLCPDPANDLNVAVWLEYNRLIQCNIIFPEILKIAQ